MASDNSDQTLASLAVGFTLGFGLLTVWEAVKQTRRSKNPRRSSYVYMIWVEIVANIAILVLANLVFHGVLTPRYELSVVELRLIRQLTPR